MAGTEIARVPRETSGTVLQKLVAEGAWIALFGEFENAAEL